MFLAVGMAAHGDGAPGGLVAYFALGELRFEARHRAVGIAVQGDETSLYAFAACCADGEGLFVAFLRAIAQIVRFQVASCDFIAAGCAPQIFGVRGLACAHERRCQ